LYWPKARRDQAVAECSRLLRQYGHLLAVDPWPEANKYYTCNSGLRFVFPALDHPATLEDVRSGRAIFSLEGQGTVRRYPLPYWPVYARWLTYRGQPVLVHIHDEEKKTDVTHVEYEQTGLVWQAEEVEVAGKWHRYYGFVGSGRIAKVPAEEIEFELWGTRWNEVFNAGVGYGFRGVRGLNLMNRSGVPQPVPPFHAADDPSPAPPGATIVDFHLYRFTGADENKIFESDWSQWREIPRKPSARLKVGGLPAQLQPMDAVTLITMDLDADYPKLAAGHYREVGTLTTMGDGPKKTVRVFNEGYFSK
jgi:hypothetical protein